MSWVLFFMFLMVIFLQFSVLNNWFSTSSSTDAVRAPSSTSYASWLWGPNEPPVSEELLAELQELLKDVEKAEAESPQATTGGKKKKRDKKAAQIKKSLVKFLTKRTTDLPGSETHNHDKGPVHLGEHIHTHKHQDKQNKNTEQQHKEEEKHQHKHEHKHDHKHEHKHGHHHDIDDLHDAKDLTVANWLKEVRPSISISWAEDMSNPTRHHSLEASEKSRYEVCTHLHTTYGVVMHETWGTLDHANQQKWKQLDCDDIASAALTSKYVLDHKEDYMYRVPTPSTKERPKPIPSSELPIIAICISITTRGLTIRSVEDLVLFKTLIPSMVRTIEPGFEYWLYLGYDFNDPWLDNAKNLEIIREWYQNHAVEPAKARGLHTRIVFGAYNNTYRKPGPAFNFLTELAFQDGATYLWRINDDQEIQTRWAQPLVDALTALGPPYGVVGPLVAEGNTMILTTDFTHRTHHIIFNRHYPHSLQAWFSDDWISQVYGKKRTVRVSSVRVSHLTSSHGTRYGEVNVPGRYLEGEKLRGKHILLAYMSHIAELKSKAKEYQDDTIDFRVPM